MNAFLLALSALSSDTSARVRKAVCQAIILLATVQLSVLEPMFGSICTFMLKGVLDEDEGAILSYFSFLSSLFPYQLQLPSILQCIALMYIIITAGYTSHFSITPIDMKFLRKVI